MSDIELIHAWKDPEADRTERASPLGEPDLADALGGLLPVSTNSGYLSFCSTCGIASYGCC